MARLAAAGHSLVVVQRAGDDERALWRRAAAGDAPAFGELFELHAQAVHRFLLRRTADRTAAEDLTSVVFLTAWKRRGAAVLTESGSGLPWLLGVAANVARHGWRAQLRHRNALTRLRGELRPAINADPAAQADERDRLRATLRDLAGLPRADRAAVELCVLAGLSYDEAAVALGVPVNTVRSRLARARRSLRSGQPTEVAP
jgi:RNA polymerase sigma factor (sigma-70 family)